MARSTARKRALNTLYEADEKGQDIVLLLAERIAEPGAQTPLPDYAIQIVRGVADEQAGIDRALEGHSTKWPLRRMAVVDRNILRIAAWEILFNDDVPDRVAIDEALGLAKTLSDDDSPAFIHGLLSALCDDKDTVLADIEAAHEAEAKEKAEREAAERRLNSPTAPGFLQQRGISGKGDGVPFETASEAGQETQDAISSGKPSADSVAMDNIDNSDHSNNFGGSRSSAGSIDGDGSLGEMSASDDVTSAGSDGIGTDSDTSDKVADAESVKIEVSGADKADSSSSDNVPIQPDSTDEGQSLPPDGDNNSIIV